MCTDATEYDTYTSSLECPLYITTDLAAETYAKGQSALEVKFLDDSEKLDTNDVTDVNVVALISVWQQYGGDKQGGYNCIMKLVAL